VCAPGNKIPLLLAVGNTELIVKAADTGGAKVGGETIGVAGTERGREAGNWGAAATTVVTDDDDDDDDDDDADAEDEEGDTDDIGTVALQLGDATDAVFGSAGTRIIEPGRVAT
jgi:hypothetical protein